MATEDHGSPFALDEIFALHLNRVFRLMSQSSAHSATIDLLLSAMSRRSGDGLRASFLFGNPDASLWERNIGAEVFFDPAGLIRAALYVRKHGHSHLRYVAVGEVGSMLQRFITENFGYLSEAFFSSAAEYVYAQLATPEAKERLVVALAKSPLFQPANELTVYPLVPVKVVSDFDSAPFFVVASASLVASRLPSTVPPQFINSIMFPPLYEWQGRRELPTAWLG